VAKRSVKKARRQGTPAAAPAAAPSRRQFWLGVLVTAAVLVPVAIAGVLIASGSDAPAKDATSPLKAKIDSEAAKLRKATGVRDKEQVKELTDRMRGALEALAPVLDGLARTLPPGNDTKAGPLAGATAVAGWRKAVRDQNAYFADTVSGETGTNVARGGFASSLDALNESVETYALAVADSGHRQALLERARQQRDLAVRTWSVAATQLDAINIAVGYGHQHVYLSGSSEAGGFTADPAPEGTGGE